MNVDKVNQSVRSLTIVTVAVTLLAYLGDFSWVFDLTRHMQLHVLLGSVGLLGISLWKRDRVAVIALTLVIVANSWTIAPWKWWSRPASTLSTKNPSAQTWSALYWNVFVHNANAEDVSQLVKDANTDFIVLLEYSPSLHDQLTELRNAYPYHLAVPMRDAFGIAGYSRLPGTWKKVSLSGGILALRFELQAAKPPLVLWGVHTLPPIGKTMQATRNEQLVELAEKVAADNQSALIVGGDFNITPWSPQFRKFLTVGGVQDASTGMGYQATWPTRLGRFGIPIDHVAVRGLNVEQLSILRTSSQSDHAAVHFRFAESAAP